MRLQRKLLISVLLFGLSGLGIASAQTPPPVKGPAAAPGVPAPAAAPAAPAAETAEALLKRVDAQLNGFKDASFHFKMRIKEPNGQVREVEFTTLQKGNSKRLVRFLAPADVKGMGFLMESAESMYALLPEFGNRVRRVGTHQTNQSFMGSDLANDDMGLLEFFPSYAPTLSGGDAQEAILDLNLRPGKPSEFPHLKAWISRQHALINKIEYYDNAGKKLRTQLRLDYKPDNPVHFSPGKMVFTDHRRNNHETELLLLESKLDQGLSDDMFTRRSLEKNN